MAAAVLATHPNKLKDVSRHENLSKADELFHLLVDGVKDYAIFAVDQERRVASWNAGACLLKGYEADEIIGQPIDRFYLPEDVAAGVPATLFETARIEGRVEAQGWRVRKDGLRFWADVVITALRDDRGHLRGYAKITRDLTERRQAEEALRVAHEDLAKRVKDLGRSNTDLEQFAYVASHDLQEPIRMVITHVQLLAEEYHDKLQGEAQEYIKFVLEGARRMQRLVKDLLTYSRVVRLAEPLSRVNCELVLQQALANLGVVIAESGAVVTHSALPTIQGGESLLVQLFQNLINNGIKFRRHGPPRVKIDAVQDHGEWILSFQDNGIGIEKDYLERIFMPFLRLHTHNEYPGTGIGLAICKHVAERHGGRIWVESTPGVGSTFYVSLPA